MDTDRITIESYNGNEPYIFVSYSHKDIPNVNKVLEIVNNEKFRVWYDDSMEIGNDFRIELQQKIQNCCAVLIFISNSFVESKYCGMEVITAYKYGKRMFPVYVEDEVHIPAAFDLIFENLQHVNREKLGSDKQMQKLISSLPVEAMRALSIEGGHLSKCKDGSPVIQIPQGITDIDAGAFKNCEKLENIRFDDDLRVVHSEAFRGCKGLKSVLLGENIKRIGDSVFRDCTGMSSVVIENEEIEIGERAFENCAGLVDLTLPKGMAEIYGGAFNSCKSLVNLNLPEELTVLGESSFADCVKLEYVKIPKNVSKIDDMAFSGCTGLKKISLNDSVVKIGKNAFKDCSSLGEITIPASVNSIGKGPFRGCSSLSEINVDPKSKNFKSVDKILFNKNKSNLICFPSKCPLSSYAIPDSVVEISDWAFCDCSSLTSVEIPDSVYEIGEGAFYRCSSLKQVIIPDSVKSIDDTAFRGCSNLEILVIPNSVEEFGWGVLNGCEKVTVICSPESVAASYCDRKGIAHRKER